MSRTADQLANTHPSATPTEAALRSVGGPLPRRADLPISGAVRSARLQYLRCRHARRHPARRATARRSTFSWL